MTDEPVVRARPSADIAAVALREVGAILRSGWMAVAPPRPLPPASPLGGRPPAVLVHGYFGNALQLRPLADVLMRHGTPEVAFVHYPSVSIPIEGILDAIADVVLPLAREHGPVDLIGHSLGALSSRLWIKRYGGARHVRRFVSLGGPHHGTAWYRVVPSPVRQAFDPGSHWIRDLNDGEEPVPTTVVRARWDHQVFPPERAAIPGAHEEVVVHAWGHNALLWSPEAHRAVLDALS